jgi:hypothetical protein
MRIAFMVFIVPGPAESARAALTDFAVISDPFFRYSIAGAAILRSFRPVLSLSVRDRQLLIRRIDDDHGEQPRRLGVTGVGAYRMMGAGALEPRLTGPVDAGRPVIDLAPDLAREDVGVDGCRAGVTVREEPSGGVDDPADEALLAGSSRPRRRHFAGGARPAAGAVARRCSDSAACCPRANSTAKPPDDQYCHRMIRINPR